MNNLKLGLGIAASLLCVCLPLTGAAQDTDDTSKVTRYITGCLQKGPNIDDYDLLAENAKWHLKSDNVRLAEHVGQEVKVAGVVSNQPYHGMKEDLKAAVQKQPTESGVLSVTNLETVAEKCH